MLHTTWGFFSSACGFGGCTAAASTLLACSPRQRSIPVTRHAEQMALHVCRLADSAVAAHGISGAGMGTAGEHGRLRSRSCISIGQRHRHCMLFACVPTILHGARMLGLQASNALWARHQQYGCGSSQGLGTACAGNHLTADLSGSCQACKGLINFVCGLCCVPGVPASVLMLPTEHVLWT
jgi:hypothetical protein